MRFIGDIHGDLVTYYKLIHECDESVQVGDFGIGFIRDNQIIDDMHHSGNHKFIRGNHDDPQLCKERCGYIPDGAFKDGIFYAGGAWSIDYAWRTPGYTWWYDEECSDLEFDVIEEYYGECAPNVMVTHDCPTSVAYKLFLEKTGKAQHITRTAEALDRMFVRHKPKIWIFGHWHEDKDVVIDETRFICLGINKYIDLEV